MATKIRLQRLGKIRSPHYRIVVADSRTKRDGKVIETIGKYHPKEDPSVIEVDSARAQYWLGVGAQPTEPVLVLLKLTGDWQTFHGVPTESRVKVAPPKADKRVRYDAEAAKALELKETDRPEAKPKKPAKTSKPAKDKADKPAKAEKAEKAEKADKPADATPAADATPES